MDQKGNVVFFAREGLPKLVDNVLSLSADHSLDSSQFWAFLDVLPVAVMVSRDRACTRIEGNVASRVLLRVPPGQNLSRSAPDSEKPPFEIYANGKLLPVSDLPMQKAAASGQTVYRSECELRFADGVRVFLAGHSVPLFDEHKNVCGSIGAFVDITHVKRLEEKNQLLSRELAHRVKNIVSVIIGVTHQTLRKQLSSESYDKYVKRLSVIARAHELLYATDSSRGDMRAIVEAAIGAVVELDNGQVEISGPDLELDPDSAVTVVMILHELATNAVKYGALSSPKGRVVVSWRPDPSEAANVARLHWRERHGPTVTPPQKLGFGSKMIRSFGKGRPGEGVHIDYEPSGVRCSFDVPTRRPQTSTA